MNALAGFLEKHIDSHQSYGQDWPSDAQFLARHRYSTWPVGWQEWHNEWFTSQAELDAWLEKQREWAKLEDNHFEYTLFKWDLGPKVVRNETYW